MPNRGSARLTESIGCRDTGISTDVCATSRSASYATIVVFRRRCIASLRPSSSMKYTGAHERQVRVGVPRLDFFLRLGQLRAELHLVVFVLGVLRKERVERSEEL